MTGRRVIQFKEGPDGTVELWAGYEAGEMKLERTYDRQELDAKADAYVRRPTQRDLERGEELARRYGWP